jgi:hypothetical protein
MFSMFPASLCEKALPWPFVFKMFPGLDTLSDGGHKVAMPFGMFEDLKAAS